MIISVLSDTHGTLHPRLPGVFRQVGVEQILHAGDVGDWAVIEQLEQIAQVIAVRGNIDTAGPTSQLPEEVRLRVAGVDLFMTHIGGKPAAWLPKLPPPLPRVAICGHSHAALVEQLGEVLFLNPGAAGTRKRFNLPLSAALLRLDDGQVTCEIVTL